MIGAEAFPWRGAGFNAEARRFGDRAESHQSLDENDSETRTAFAEEAEDPFADLRVAQSRVVLGAGGDTTGLRVGNITLRLGIPDLSPCGCSPSGLSGILR